MEANKRITTQRISDLWRKAVPIFPSYAPANVTYTNIKITEGASAGKNASRRFQASMMPTKNIVPSQSKFSVAANILDKLDTSAPNNGLKRKVNVVCGDLQSKQTTPSTGISGSNGQEKSGITDAAPTWFLLC